MNKPNMIHIPAMPPEVIEVLKEHGTILTALGSQIADALEEAPDDVDMEKSKIMLVVSCGTAEKLSTSLAAVLHVAALFIAVSEKANDESSTKPDGAKIH